MPEAAPEGQTPVPMPGYPEREVSPQHMQGTRSGALPLPDGRHDLFPEQLDGTHGGFV